MAEGKSSTLATDAPLLSAIMAQKMQDLDPEEVVDQVFVPIPAFPSEFMLGPCFTTKFPSKLTPFYPLVKGEKLLLHSSAPDWWKAKTIRTWPGVNKVWTDWVDRVQRAKGELWKSAGIYDAIQLSRLEIPMDKNLLYAALCFWSISNNSFHLRFGMMGPTVLDIVALTGLRPHGEEVSALLDDPELAFAFPKNERGKDIMAYWKFVDVSTGVTDVTDHEHISFLAMWLCKYLFCNASLKMTKEYTQLAIALASGRKLALAPFVLSHLYRGCRDITVSKFGNAAGPFWILQLWLHSYFPEYRPLPYDMIDAPTYGFPLAKGELRPKTFDECFRFFHSCSSRTARQFTPFSCWTFGPEWFKKSLDPSLSKFDNKEIKDIWASYLIARDLHYSLVVDKTVNCKCGVEFYSPNQFARQFGLTQAIPLPLHRTANVSLVTRVVFHSADWIHEIRSRFDKLKKKFKFVTFDENPKSTILFDSWWSMYIADTRTESVDDILKRISPTVAPLPSPVKQELIASDCANSHHVSETAGEQDMKKRKVMHKVNLIPSQPLVSQEVSEELESSAEEEVQPSKKAKIKSTEKVSRTPRAQSSIKLATKTSVGCKSNPAISIMKSFAADLNCSLTPAKPIGQEKTEMNIQVKDLNSSSSCSSFSSDHEARPMSPSPISAKIGGNFSFMEDSAKVPIKLDNIEEFFARVTGQLRQAQSLSSAIGQSSSDSTSNTKFASGAKHSMEALAKAKEDVERLLARPFQDLFLPENQSTLKAALSTYAASPDLPARRLAALQKLKTSLPSLSSTFCRAKKDQAEYYKKAAKKVLVIDELAKGQEIYTNLRDCHEKLGFTMDSIKDHIKELKLSLKEAQTKKKAIEGQQLALANTCCMKSAHLEDMEAEFPALEEKKELADTDMIHVEATWADFKPKIFDS